MRGSRRIASFRCRLAIVECCSLARSLWERRRFLSRSTFFRLFLICFVSIQVRTCPKLDHVAWPNISQDQITKHAIAKKELCCRHVPSLSGSRARRSIPSLCKVGTASPLLLLAPELGNTRMTKGHRRPKGALPSPLLACRIPAFLRHH